MNSDEKFLDSQSYMAALNRVQGIIEFDLDGKILYANNNFLNTMGYSLEDIVGKHHRIFCDAEYVSGVGYRQFWEKLGRGEFDQGEYKRIAKNGREIWIFASYNPIIDINGKPYKIVKFARASFTTPPVFSKTPNLALNN